MKRLYTPVEKDEIAYEIDNLQASIIRLKRKFHTVGLTEQEFKQLDIEKRKLRHLKGLRNGDY